MSDLTLSGAAIPAAVSMAVQARRIELFRAAAIFALIAVLPLVVRDVYLQNILILTLLYAALSQSWNILGGYCGQISLGHALYFGIGAYATSVLFVSFGLIPWLGLGIGGILAAAVALLLGYPCFR
ncbi:MAG: ABC transporter permease subunit, partial [Phreatobacter sp.]